MNKLWDDLKDNMKEWGVSAVEKAEEISRVAVAKGEEFTKISKLKFEILQLQKDKNKIYERLGLLVYNKTNESNVSNFTGDVEYFSLIEKINKYSIEISEKFIITPNFKDSGIINLLSSLVFTFAVEIKLLFLSKFMTDSFLLSMSI